MKRSRSNTCAPHRRLAVALPALLLAAVPALALPLDGTYTIGGQDPHFLTIQDATAALQAEGISGPVVFDIRPGTYDGPVVVLDVTGASAADTITFQSETGIADDVVVASDTGGVWFVSGDWVTLQHLTLRQDSGPFEEYARVLEVSGDVNHVQVLHNKLIGTTATTTIHDRYAVLFNWKTSTYAADDVLIEGNEILNGSVGIYWGGSSLFEGSGLRIRNNSIRDWGMRGVQILTEPGVEVVDNEISTSSTYSIYPYGLLLESCRGAVRIEKNRISATYVGLSVRESLGTVDAPGLIANNFVRVGYPASLGLDLYESEYQQALHNTVLVSSNFASGVALSVYYGAHNVLLGNVAMNDDAGSAIKITFPESNVDQSDFNLLYAVSGVLGITSTFEQHATLADWQAATGLDAGSLEAEPLFVAPDDLHLDPASPGIDAALPGVVADDIDYALRPPQPDIGADEQGYSACEFLAVLAMADCPLDNGAIDLTAVAGEPPFTFAWSDGADTEDRVDLAPGIYSVEVTNDAGCDWSGSFEIECAPGDPLLELVVDSVVDATCAGDCDGAAQVSARGGEPPYSYYFRSQGGGWQPSAGYEDSLCAGRYAFRVRDASGAVATVDVTIAEPPALRMRPVSRENVSCHGGSDGSFELAARGGVAPYRFSKDGGVSWQDSGYFDGLPAGRYPVRVEDANECSLDRSVRLLEPTELLLTVVAITDESSPGAGDGSIEVASSGGTGNHEYSIDGGATWQESPLFTGLFAGTYTILVQDENSCVTSVTAEVG